MLVLLRSVIVCAAKCGCSKNRERQRRLLRRGLASQLSFSALPKADADKV